MSGTLVLAADVVVVGDGEHDVGEVTLDDDTVFTAVEEDDAVVDGMFGLENVQLVRTVLTLRLRLVKDGHDPTGVDEYVLAGLMGEFLECRSEHWIM